MDLISFIGSSRMSWEQAFDSVPCKGESAPLE
jgi:hypothetical protein